MVGEWVTSPDDSPGMVTLKQDKSRAGIVFWICGALLLAYILARVIHFSGIEGVQEFPDTIN